MDDARRYPRGWEVVRAVSEIRRGSAGLLHPVPAEPVLLLAEFGDDETVETISRACDTFAWSYRLVTDTDRVAWTASVLHPAAILVVDLGRQWSEQVVSAARAAAPRVPLVVLGSLSAQRALSVLKRGADAIVPPGLEPEEMLGRIYAIIRRVREIAAPTTRFLESGDLRVDLWAGELTIAGNAVALTTMEFRLLSYLMRHAERTLSSHRIVDEVWRASGGGGENALRISIGRLRSKVGDDARSQRLIRAVRGRGYKFVRPVNEVPDETRVSLEAPGESVYLEHIGRLAQRLALRRSRAEMCEELVAHMVESVMVDGAAVHDLTTSGLVLRAQVGLSPAWISAMAEELPPDEGYASVRSIRAGQPIQLNSSTTNYRLTRAILRQENPATYLFLPIGDGGEVGASLGLVRWSQHPFDAATLDYLQSCLVVFDACVALVESSVTSDEVPSPPQ